MWMRKPQTDGLHDGQLSAGGHRFCAVSRPRRSRRAAIRPGASAPQLTDGHDCSVCQFLAQKPAPAAGHRAGRCRARWCAGCGYRHAAVYCVRRFRRLAQPRARPFSHERLSVGLTFPRGSPCALRRYRHCFQQAVAHCVAIASQVVPTLDWRRFHVPATNARLYVGGIARGDYDHRHA